MINVWLINICQQANRNEVMIIPETNKRVTKTVMRNIFCHSVQHNKRLIRLKLK